MIYEWRDRKHLIHFMRQNNHQISHGLYISYLWRAINTRLRGMHFYNSASVMYYINLKEANTKCIVGYRMIRSIHTFRTYVLNIHLLLYERLVYSSQNSRLAKYAFLCLRPEQRTEWKAFMFSVQKLYFKFDRY